MAFDLAKMLQELSGEGNFSQGLGSIFGNLMQGQSVGPSPQRGRSGIDTLQNVLDVAGVVDPTPTIDAVNAGISLFRAARARNSRDRQYHLQNAVISGISMLPYVGDTAKLTKFNRATGKAASANPPVAHPSMNPPSGAPPVPPPAPPGAPPSGGAPPVPPPPPSGPPPTPGGSGFPGYPFVIGAAAGGLVGAMSDYSPAKLPRRKYDIPDLITSSAQREMGSDVSRMVGRQAEATKESVMRPMSPETWATAAKATLDNVREMPAALMNWAESLKDSQEHLKAFSGIIANAMLESQVREMIRNIGSADRTGVSTRDLTRALDDVKDEIQPYRDLMTNISNKVAEYGLRLLDTGIGILKHMTTVDEIVDILNKWFSPDQPSDVAAFEFMENIRKLPEELTRRPRR